MARMEYYVLNDIELSFKDVLKRSIEGKPLPNQKELDAWEARREDRLKSSTNGETKNGNGANPEKKDKKTRKASGKSNTSEHEEYENGEVESETETPEKSESEKLIEKEKLLIEKAKAVERSAIVAPQLNLQQMEAAIAKGGGLGYDQEMINDLMAQTYAASVRWPKDPVLHARLQHIVTSLDTDKWPVAANYCYGDNVSLSGPATPEPSHNTRDTSTPLSEVDSIVQNKILK